MTKTRSDTEGDEIAKAESPPLKQWRKPAFARLDAALAELGPFNASSDGFFTTS